MRLLTTLLVLTASMSPAAAQDRGFVIGVGGLTFGRETSSAIAGGVILPVTPTFQIIGEIGRLQNIASREARDEADRVERAIEDSTAAGGIFFDVESDVTAPAFYAMSAARFAGRSRRARPFVGAGAGFARVSPEFQFRFALDDSDITFEAIEAGFVTETASTHALVAASAGVALDAGASVAVEVGYTWLHVFTRRGTNLSRVHGGLAFRF